MPRRLFYPKEEILSKDFNTLRNDYEKLVLERFLGKAVPRIPAFIAGSFKPVLNGNQVNVEPGIGLQRVAQTDGSTPVRLMALDAQQTMSFVLPAVGQTKKALVQARSRIVNDTTEQRNFKVGASVQDRSTLVSNRWSAEVAVKDNVVADANGNYVADIGWVPVAIVTLNSSGITALEDARDFYNLFDPDFFSVYGRKNVSFQRPWDGVTLVEVPFEFSDLVPKLDQVSVRRVTKETFGEITTSQMFSKNFTWNKPQSITDQRWIGGLLFGETWNQSDTATHRSSHLRYNNDIAGYSTYRFVQPPPVVQRRVGNDFRVGITNDGDRKLVYWFSGDGNSVGWGSSGDIYLALYTGGGGFASDLTRLAVWRVPKSIFVNRNRSYNHWGFNHGSGANHYSYIQSFDTSGYLPIYKGSNFTNVSNPGSMRLRVIDSRNPLQIQNLRDVQYDITSELSITNFFALKNVVLNTDSKELSVILKDANGLTVSDSDLFDYFVIKKGTEQRLRRTYESNSSIEVSGSEITIKWALTNQEYAKLIKSTDTAFDDMNIEFVDVDTQGEEIWRANPMRGGSTLSSTVDFKLEEEGLRTYVRLNPGFSFADGDQLIFSHIIPQELIDAGSGGTPEDQDVATQVAALQASLAALQRDVSANKGDIDTLENQTAASRITFYYGDVFVGARNATSRANAKSVSHLTPLVSADFANPAQRTAKEISSLLLGGGRVQYNGGSVSGYYTPWVAIKSSDVTNLYVEGSGGDETDLWRPADTADLGGETYNLYVRTSPILNGKSANFIFKDYE